MSPSSNKPTGERGSAPLRLWGGIECTVNRVADVYVDQCAKNGHDSRSGDLERFRELGLDRIRYPFLWEKIAPAAEGEFDWTQSDLRMAELRAAGLNPIAGLLHHGSGPAYTDLMDRTFPKKFAAFARAFAERYPEVEDYTPINEPLTTARFSGLYGVWYPHAKKDRSFVRALYNQVRATRDAMREIRKVNPRARLIQTDDLGRARGTRVLKYQVDFENDRRWLGFDLLAGRVVPAHPLHYFLLKNGLKASELDDLAADPARPDVIGVNHYLLSNRYLDHRCDLYPAHLHGGNERHSYADCGAVDVRHVPYLEPKEIYREAWERYGLPIAITEAHTHGPRETQLRWFTEIWNAARELRAEGADVLAVTAWSLIGTYDWNSLCTRDEGFYEPGVYDVRSKTGLRATALVQLLKMASSGGELSEVHPVVQGQGWWRGAERGVFGEKSVEILCGSSTDSPKFSEGRPLAILGAAGSIGAAFVRLCRERGLAYRAYTHAELDARDENAVREMLVSVTPWAMIDATAGNDRSVLESLAARFSTPVVQFLAESDAPNLAESASPAHVLRVRTGKLFSPWNHRSVPSRRGPAPTYLPDLVHGTLDLLIDGETGLVHLANAGSRGSSDFSSREGLSSTRVAPLPVIDDAIARYYRDREKPARPTHEESGETAETISSPSKGPKKS